MIGKHEEAEGLETLTVNVMNTSFYLAVKDIKLLNWKGVISGWLQYVDKEWSRFQSDNELDQLNKLEIGEEMMVSPPLIDILQQAELYRQLSDGLFSPYLLPQIQFHGYQQSFPFEHANAANGAMPLIFETTTAPFQFDIHSSTVKRVASGQIDLGGIGKGYAVQAAAKWLKNEGKAKAGIVDGGGDISVWSDGSKEWKIGVVHPYLPNEEIGQFRIKNGSIATSNIVFRSWVQGNRKKHHLLNGKNGLPVRTSIIQATVVSDNCLDAEVMAKLCFMEVGQRLTDLLNIINQNYSILLVNEDGVISKYGGGIK